MRVTFLCRSDLRGGAAIVTYRLMLAMRESGIDARMLVCEKLSDSPYVDYCAPKWKIQYAFLKERLNVFYHNGCNRDTLFKIDPAADGLPVWNHPWVREADAIYLAWVNQGMVSLDGVARLAKIGKPLTWIMHDMWNMTGICHHAGSCTHFQKNCGDCPLLGKKASPKDMSFSTWKKKKKLYDNIPIRFVAVSSWLAGKAEESSLLKGRGVEVIPNAFPIADTLADEIQRKEKKEGDPIRIIFGAARIDDPIKGLPILKDALQILHDNYPEESANLELVTFGTAKYPESLDGFAVPTQHLGMLSGEEAIRKAYEQCDIVVSASDFETLPGTLIEGQAYGCFPVAFDHGGQRDIIRSEEAGCLVAWSDDPHTRAHYLAETLLRASKRVGDPKIIRAMRQSVIENFSPQTIINKLLYSQPVSM